MSPRNRTLIARLRWLILPLMGYCYGESWRDQIRGRPFVWLDNILGRLPGSDLFAPVPEVVCNCDWCRGVPGAVWEP